MHSLLRSAVLGAALLSATPAFAAEVAIEPAVAGSITVDATVYHVAAPDMVNMNVSCESQQTGSRLQVRQHFREMLQKMADTVGTDGTVRRNGTPGIYPYYSGAYDSGVPSEFSGSMQVTVLGVRAGEGMRISDAMEDMGCTVSWDVRLLSSVKYARQYHDELMEQIAEKKAYFESLLGTRLTKVNSIYVSTFQDTGSYYGNPASYDAETDSLPAMTTLTITYDIGTGEK